MNLHERKSLRRPRTMHRIRCRRAGFTLVEVLLALAMTMLLLAATYSALTLFQRVTVAGRADAERSQLARAIEHRMSADIRCVLFRAEPETMPTEESGPAAGLAMMNEGVGAADDPGGTTDGRAGTAGASGGSNTSANDSISANTSTSGSGSTTGETTAPATPADAYAAQSVGVFGDATTLVLHVSKPARPPLSVPVTSATPLPGTMPVVATHASDLRSISYFLAVAGGGGLQGAVGNMAAGGSAQFATEQGQQGLARLDGDRLAIQMADQAGDFDLLAQNATILAPEVTEIGFRYFDGIGWVTTWDSVTLGMLPRAIEVTVRIDVDAEMPPQVSALDAPPPPSASDVYRFVVALPVADPTQGLAL